jgi:hypothetical protein
MTTIHPMATTSGIAHQPPAADLSETIEWFDAKGRAKGGLPDHIDVDLRIWQDGRAGLHLTPDQCELLAPGGTLYWALKAGRLVFAARYRPPQSSASRSHGMVQVNARGQVAISGPELARLIRGRRMVQMNLAGAMYVSVQKLGSVHIEGTLRTNSPTVADLPPVVVPDLSPVDQLRELVTGFNTQYSDLLPALEGMRPSLTVEPGEQAIRAHLKMTL